MPIESQPKVGCFFKTNLVNKHIMIEYLKIILIRNVYRDYVVGLAYVS